MNAKLIANLTKLMTDESFLAEITKELPTADEQSDASEQDDQPIKEGSYGDEKDGGDLEGDYGEELEAS